MTATPPEPTPETPKPKRVQVNVRLPEDLRDEIDRRRARKDMSRDVWVERALRYALATSPQPRPTRHR